MITIGNSASSFYSIHLYTNGIATIVEAPIKLYALLYGGANGAPLSADSHITVREGAYASSIFGGSLNADFDGNASIVIEGTAISVVGGCRAYASGDGTANASASMSGSSNILVTETGGVKTIIGGGEACFPSSGSTVLTATANLFGSTSITVEGHTDEVYGGGSAGADSIALSDLSNTTGTATVSGDASITFGAKAQVYSTSSSVNKMEVWGGGLATGTRSDANRATADVLGCARITALEDDTAAQAQPNAKSFSRFYGGGCALFRNAQANTGATEIKTARCAWESAAGIIGGGYAGNGGTADVLGSTHVETFGFDGQMADYENANLVAGGGLAEGNQITDGTSATAGSTEVIIHRSTRLTSGSSTSMNVIGGGIAKSKNCVADVAGPAQITIESGTTVPMGITGGGIAWGGSSGALNASANVGSTAIDIGEGCTTNSWVIGGGYVFSKAASSTANVIGDTAISVGDNSACAGNFFVGGGLSNGSDGCEASIGGNVITSFGNGIATKSFVGGGFSYNGSTNCTTNVRGSIDTTFGDDYTMTAGQFIGAGYVYYNATDCTSTAQAAHTEMGDNANLSGKWVAAAGRVAGTSTGDARLASEKDETAVSFEAGTNFAAYVFSAGGYINGDKTGASTVSITGNVATSFGGGDIKFYYGGAYLSETNGDGSIQGSAQASFTGFTFPTQDGTMPRIGSDISGDAKLVFADSTLNAAFHASTAQNIGGTQTIGFVGTSSLNEFIYAEHQAGEFLVEVGDSDKTPTTATMSGIYSPNHKGETNILVHDGATLIPNTTSADSAGNPYHLMGIYTIELEAGGNLLTYNEHPTVIFGSLLGPSADEEVPATITMPASATIVSDPSLGKTLEGTLTLKPTGTVAAGMTLLDFPASSGGAAALDDSSPARNLYLAKDTASQAGRALWTIATGSNITVKQTEHGVIAPDGEFLNKNEPTTYTFTPDYGYRLDAILVNGTPVDDSGEADGRVAEYTFTPSGDTCEISASFIALEKDDVESVIENLPEPDDSTALTDEDKDTILDTKLDYEAYIEANPDTPLDPDTADRLHEALLQIPEIQVEIVIEVAVESGSTSDAVEVSKDCLHHFVYRLGKDEIEALRTGSAELLKIKAVVNEDIDQPYDAEAEALEAALGTEYSFGKHYNVIVEKQVFEKKDDIEPQTVEALHVVEQGITMTFAVPASLLPHDGAERVFSIVRTHQNDDGSWEAAVLDDENEADPNSITITSDRFSRYAIVYREASDSVDPELPSPEPGIDSPGDFGSPSDPVRRLPPAASAATGGARLAQVGDRVFGYGFAFFGTAAVAVGAAAIALRRKTR